MKKHAKQKKRRKQSSLQISLAKITYASALIGLIAAIIAAACQLQPLLPI